MSAIRYIAVGYMLRDRNPIGSSCYRNTCEESLNEKANYCFQPLSELSHADCSDRRRTAVLWQVVHPWPDPFVAVLGKQSNRLDQELARPCQRTRRQGRFQRSRNCQEFRRSWLPEYFGTEGQLEQRSRTDRWCVVVTQVRCYNLQCLWLVQIRGRWNVSVQLSHYHSLFVHHGRNQTPFWCYWRASFQHGVFPEESGYANLSGPPRWTASWTGRSHIDEEGNGCKNPLPSEVGRKSRRKSFPSKPSWSRNVQRRRPSHHLYRWMEVGKEREAGRQGFCFCTSDQRLPSPRWVCLGLFRWESPYGRVSRWKGWWLRYVTTWSDASFGVRVFARSSWLCGSLCFGTRPSRRFQQVQLPSSPEGLCSKQEVKNLQVANNKPLMHASAVSFCIFFSVEMAGIEPTYPYWDYIKSSYVVNLFF